MKLNTGIIKITMNYAKWFIPGIKDLTIIKKNNAIHEKKNHLNRCQKMGGDRNLRENGYVYMYY